MLPAMNLSPPLMSGLLDNDFENPEIWLRIRMNSKLYVRNLSSSITENELRTLFEQSGTVILVDIIRDRVSGRSKGYGFIQMSNPAEAENAVEMFDGYRGDNCELRVGLT